jgi:hypothetical protein
LAQKFNTKEINNKGTINKKDDSIDQNIDGEIKPNPVKNLLSSMNKNAGLSIVTETYKVKENNIPETKKFGNFLSSCNDESKKDTDNKPTTNPMMNMLSSMKVNLTSTVTEKDTERNNDKYKEKSLNEHIFNEDIDKINNPVV